MNPFQWHQDSKIISYLWVVPVEHPRILALFFEKKLTWIFSHKLETGIFILLKRNILLTHWILSKNQWNRAQCGDCEIKETEIEETEIKDTEIKDTEFSFDWSHKCDSKQIRSHIKWTRRECEKRWIKSSHFVKIKAVSHRAPQIIFM